MAHSLRDRGLSGCQRETLKVGYSANGTEWKGHLDGYNFLPYFNGEVDDGPCQQIFYFGQGGELNAIRWND